MKKIIIFLILILFTTQTLVLANEPVESSIKIFVNGDQLNLPVKPVIVNDRTLVPVRIICEKLGADVLWDAEERSVEITKGDNWIGLLIDMPYANDNGIMATLETSPIIYNSHTMVPLRFVGECMGLEVVWDGENKTITLDEIETPPTETIAFDSFTYTGQLKNGIPHGKGKIYITSSDTLYYEGNLKNGIFNGQGKLFCDDGYYWAGTFVDGKRNGKFEFYDASGNILYIVDYVDDQKEGIQMCFVDGVRASNIEFRNGVPTGYGEIFWDKLGDDGVRHTWYVGGLSGDFPNCVPNGVGTMYDVNGEFSQYGEYINGELNGYGEVVYSEKNGNEKYLYVGNFKEGLRHGEGKLYKDGKLYVSATYNNDKFHGIATYYLENGDIDAIYEYENDRIVDELFYVDIENPENNNISDYIEEKQSENYSYEYGSGRNYETRTSYYSTHLFASDRSIKFPLYLYADNDQKTYLGKLVTDKFDQESIFYTFGDYGNKFSKTCIFNKFSDFGSSYGRYSAFNDLASNPPIIVDRDGNFVAYLTNNESKPNSLNYYQLLALLREHDQ